MEQVVEWQNRPLDAVYPIVYLDCIVLKVRQDSRLINKSVFLALGINIVNAKIIGRLGMRTISWTALSFQPALLAVHLGTDGTQR